VIDRLPAWAVPESDREEFNRPPQTLLPPLVGETIEGVFPPAPVDAPDDPAAGPLQVLRYQPEGPVDVAPFLSVTFDQPMVPLATLEQLDAADVPVVVTPAVEGRWRWIGTRTLRFEVVPGDLDRLPGSTDYVVEVPAGTVAANGAELPETVSWTFTTPTVGVTDFVGDDESLPLNPVFVAVFDQRVDAQAVLDTIELEAGGEVRPVRLAAKSRDRRRRQRTTSGEQALPGRPSRSDPRTRSRPTPTSSSGSVRARRRPRGRTRPTPRRRSPVERSATSRSCAPRATGARAAHRAPRSRSSSRTRSTRPSSRPT
jgi:alpha-2-macroglobulin